MISFSNICVELKANLFFVSEQIDKSVRVNKDSSYLLAESKVYQYSQPLKEINVFLFKFSKKSFLLHSWNGKDNFCKAKHPACLSSSLQSVLKSPLYSLLPIPFQIAGKKRKRDFETEEIKMKEIQRTFSQISLSH